MNGKLESNQEAKSKIPILTIASQNSEAQKRDKTYNGRKREEKI